MSNQSENSKATKIQSLVDEHKNELGDGLYKKLCDALMEDYKEERTVDEKMKGLFKVRYLKPKLLPHGSSVHVSLECENVIVELNKPHAERMIKTIGEIGYCVMDEDDVRGGMRSPEMFSYMFTVEPDDDECECCSDRKSRMENIPYHYHLHVLSVKKVE